MLKKFGLSFAALVTTVIIAAAAGLWQGYPIVGGASYCETTVNNTCVQTIPAGPSIVTGTEKVPADTGLAGGRSPQTVLIPTATLMGNNTSLQTGATITYTVAAGISNVVLSHTTTITSAAITAPAAPIDGQRVKISADQTVTTFSFVANTGQTLSVATPTVLTASTTVPQGYEFIYVASTAKWYRMQ